MDNSFHQQGSDTQRPRSLFTSMQILARIPNWLARLAQLTQLTEEEQMHAGIRLRQLTEEEQMDAGLDPGDPHDK